MRSFLLFCLLTSLTSCSEQELKPQANYADLIERFISKQKFVPDEDLYYPGLADEKLRPVLTAAINQAATDFKQVAESKKPTAEAYRIRISIGLSRFSGIYANLDTEERERICSYYEELMDIVNLDSSGGLLNEFLYGFNFGDD